MKRNILIIGKGGREHAIAHKIARSRHVNQVFVIPGNAGMRTPKITCVDLATTKFSELIAFAKAKEIKFTIVGPETELCLGIVDAFEKENLKIFGPSKYCAQIEGSKAFCKLQMQRYQIPTSEFAIFNNLNAAYKYIKNTNEFPIVIKADGLAAGKGVVIPKNLSQAKEYLEQIFTARKFGDAGNQVVVEKFLLGQEFSQLAFVHNEKIAFMQIARDYKRAFDNDQGENTGGMGVYTPINFLSEAEIAQGKTIIKKMVAGLAKDGRPYKGVLYAGLMATFSGVKVIEFNVRFGDPEAEAILRSLESDLYVVISDLLANKPVQLKWNQKCIVGVVLASEGYPDNYSKHQKLDLTQLTLSEYNDLYFMGVDRINETLVSNGGRVLISMGEASTWEEAKHLAYEKVAKISNANFFYRKDIAKECD